jgi:hypothetical protein
MRYYSIFLVLWAVSCCAQVPPIPQSREALWQQFGQKPVDAVLMSWGAPAKETHLTDGSRLLTYRRSTIYDAQSPYEQVSACEVSFLAHPPAFNVDDIAMQGAANECHMLSEGRIGEVRVPMVEPAYTYRSPARGPYPFSYPF